jgi:hypothetical protein
MNFPLFLLSIAFENYSPSINDEFDSVRSNTPDPPIPFKNQLSNEPAFRPRSD